MIKQNLIKTGLIFLMLGLIIISCNKDKTKDFKIIPACSVDNPTTDLDWLSEIISKAETDKTGNYLGNIWIKNYNGNDYIISDMMMGSGGVAFHCFNCQGEIEVVDDLEFYNSLSDDNLVYSNIPVL